MNRWTWQKWFYLNATQEVRESNDLGELNLEYTTSQLKMLCFCRTEKIPRGGPKKVDGWTWSRKIKKKINSERSETYNSYSRGGAWSYDGGYDSCRVYVRLEERGDCFITTNTLDVLQAKFWNFIQLRTNGLNSIRRFFTTVLFYNDRTTLSTPKQLFSGNVKKCRDSARGRQNPISYTKQP